MAECELVRECMFELLCVCVCVCLCVCECLCYHIKKYEGKQEIFHHLGLTCQTTAQTTTSQRASIIISINDRFPCSVPHILPYMDPVCLPC